MIPETNISLILRLADHQDHDAWHEFETVYRPVVYFAARQNGMQDADAEDTVQQVMVSVAKAIRQRPHDAQRAKFRTWLFRVTQNAVIDAMRRRRPDQGSGRTSVIAQLGQIQSEDDIAPQMEVEFQNAVFRWAADRIRSEFQPTTWQAFWLTMVDGVSCDQAADRLGVGIGSVYAARSRVIRRLKNKIEEFDDSCQIR